VEQAGQIQSSTIRIHNHQFIPILCLRSHYFLGTSTDVHVLLAWQSPFLCLGEVSEARPRCPYLGETEADSALPPVMIVNLHPYHSIYHLSATKQDNYI